jgi:hypothetical protein
MPEQDEPPTKDVDVDAEMTETQDASAVSAPRNDNEASSGALDQDSAQPETQHATAWGLSPHNRKDVSLREFLSKMDDYAPIVRISPTNVEGKFDNTDISL